MELKTIDQSINHYDINPSEDEFIINMHRIRYKYNQLMNIISRNGYLLRFVPEESKSQELCETACRQNGYAIQYVPEKFQE
jgi:hypothetical protein